MIWDQYQARKKPWMYLLKMAWLRKLINTMYYPILYLNSSLINTYNYTIWRYAK